MKILALETANIKRIKAIQIIPTGPLVTLAGKNKQGKTSILDSIMWVLGGAGNIQAVPLRKGEKEGVIRVTLGDKGPELLVELKITEKGQYLKLRNADGSKPGGGEQAYLNRILGKLTFDPVAFMREKPVDQLAIIKSIVTLTDEDGKPLDLMVMDAQSKAAYADRTENNRDHRNTQARADAITVPADLPDDAPDVPALMVELGEVATYNGDIERERVRRENRAADQKNELDQVSRIEAEITEIEDRLADARERLQNTKNRAAAIEQEIAALPPMLVPKDVAAIQAQIAAARQIEEGLKQRGMKAELLAEAEAYANEAAAKTAIIDGIEETKAKAIARAKMPVPGLGFGDNGVIFNDLPLEQASDAEQLQVSVAIAAALNPTLRVMRVRDGSILDSVAMAALEQFGADNDYQIWIEIVDESGEVGITIEDGGVRGQELTPEAVLNKGKDKPPADDTPASGQQGAPAPVTDPARQHAARTFLTQALADLVAIRKDAPDGPAQVAKLHGTVKAKLKNFPELIAAEWNPAKIAHEATLKPKAPKE